MEINTLGEILKLTVMKKINYLWSSLIALMVLVLVSCGGSTVVDGREAVDLGLSVKWATANVGASTPDSKGDYFAWGETSTKTLFTWKNSKMMFSNVSEIQGRSDYDAATKEWGSNWRMPTQREIQELVDKCKWEWSREGDCQGYKVTGPSGNSIFLPAGGCSYDGTVHFKNSAGLYWSGTAEGGNMAYIIATSDAGTHSVITNNLYFGCLIRPVTEK